MIPAGQRDRRLTIQQGTEVVDAFGEPDVTWSTYATRWVKITTQGGGEALTAGTDRTARRVEIRALYTAGVTEKMRGLEGSTVYDFEMVNHESRDGETIILATVRS